MNPGPSFNLKKEQPNLDNSFSREEKVRPFSKTGARNSSPYIEKNDGSKPNENDSRNTENRKFAKPMIAKSMRNSKQ